MTTLISTAADGSSKIDVIDGSFPTSSNNDKENDFNDKKEGQENENDEDDDQVLLYKEYMSMIENLPEGWTRNPRQGERGQAPFVHTSSGRVSWKNPNQDKIKDFMKKQQERQRRWEALGTPLEYQVPTGNKTTSPLDNNNNNNNKKSMVKKLRLMLQAGAPLEAVERRAAVENIDMSLVLSTEGTAAAAASSSASTSTSNVVISSVLLKKYVRMRKMGVGLAQVQQLAYVEAKLQPEQVVELLAMNDQGSNSNNNNNKTSDQPSMVVGVDPASPRVDYKAKYRRMEKAGLPFPAIAKTAQIDGISSKRLETILFGNDNKNDDDDDDVMPVTGNDTGKNDNDESNTSLSNGSDGHGFFTLIGLNKVSFDANSDLAALVRKMAHTVDKKADRSGGNDSSLMVVDTMTLYHALGSLQGVRVARDDYNMTCCCCDVRDNDNNSPNRTTSNIAWIKAKRQSFCEMARGIGMRLPVDFSTTVNVDGLDELIAFLERRFQNDIQDIRRLLDRGYYDFDSLAVMYQPGSRVVAKNAGGGGVDMMCKVAWNRYQQGKTIMGRPTKYFQVCLEYVVAVGANSATVAEVVEGMESFDGKRSLLGGLLQFVPWNAYGKDQQESLLGRYRNRGEKYNQVALNVMKGDCTASSSSSTPPKSYSYRAYSKGSFFVKQGGGAGTLVGGGGNPSAALATGGRIIIDNQGAFDYGHSLNIGYDPMITGIKYKLKEYKLQMRDDENSKHQAQGRSNDDDSGMVLFHCIPEDYLEFVWPCVVGFSLSAKAWGDCLVDGLEDIVFYDDVFDRLVLPESRKRLVKALVKHSAGINGGPSGFQDLIAGKGEGTVFLLHGPPGVGKTLTAEAVAEVLKRPLFSVSMGTLGTTADELEKRLGEILKLSAKWDAIILLDEADSFLEARSSTSSLERNAMVSVMLKLVEYFSGILFLTSNRFDSLDPAFQTRITLSLEYENLDAASRKKVWENLFAKSGISNSSFDLDGLAQFPLNGREIKNALRLALALATEEKCALSHEMLMETAAMIKPVKKEDKMNGNKFLSLFHCFN